VGDLDPLTRRLGAGPDAGPPIPGDPLAGLPRQAAHGVRPFASAGSAVNITSLVRVSRSAMNHARHPER